MSVDLRGFASLGELCAKQVQSPRKARREPQDAKSRRIAVEDAEPLLIDGVRTRGIEFLFNEQSH
jgi:hypothetical protein